MNLFATVGQVSDYIGARALVSSLTQGELATWRSWLCEVPLDL